MAEVTPTNSLIPGGNQSTIDAQSVSVIQRNSFLLGSVSTQIANISAQMGAMSQSLAQVQQTIAQNTFLEKQREANEQRRQQQLADAAVRQGAESRAESRIQSAVMFPVRRLAGKVEFGLQRLMNTFTFLFTGWLAMRTLAWFKAKQDGSERLMKNISDTIRKSLISFGVILAITLAGVGTIIGGIGRLGIKIASFGIKNLVVRPVGLFLNFLRGLAGKALTALGLGGIGRKILSAAPALGSKFGPKGALIGGALGFGGGMLLNNWMQGEQAQQSGLTQGQDGSITQTVSKGNQWWDFLGMVPDGTEQVQVDQEKMSQMLHISEHPQMYSGEQVAEARAFIQNPAGSGGEVQPVQPTEQAVTGKEEKRGWWSRALGVVDAVTGGATDFDNMGSEGQIFNPISGGSDAKWGAELGPIEEPPAQIVQIPAVVNTSGMMGGGSSDGGGGGDKTPKLSSSDINNIYSMAAQSNFNVVSA